MCIEKQNKNVSEQITITLCFILLERATISDIKVLNKQTRHFSKLVLRNVFQKTKNQIPTKDKHKLDVKWICPWLKQITSNCIGEYFT